MIVQRHKSSHILIYNMQHTRENAKLNKKNTLLASSKKTMNKICKDDVIILLPGQQEKLKLNNYLVSHLKTMCRHYCIQHDRANKDELIMRLFLFLSRYKSAATIQKAIRKSLLQTYISAKGPAHFKRTICVNETDFFTMSKMIDIDYEQFISFVDKDGMVYGFDIMSLQNLLTKGSKPYRNPYNRNELPQELLDNMNILYNLSPK
jgi:hypothetical protein